MINLAIRILSQIKNDKRTLGLILFAPLLVITLIYFILNDTHYKPTVGVINVPETIVSKIKEDMKVIKIEKKIDKNQYLKAEKVDALIWIEESINVKMVESSNKTNIINKSLKKISNDIEMSFIYGKEDDSTFNRLGHVFLGILPFFFIFLISGVALVRERTNKTIERLLMTPIKRYQVIFGYTLAFSILAVIQSIIIFLYVHYILGLPSLGNVGLCILIMVLLAIVAVSLGIFISIFASSEFQVVQFIPTLIIPQIFFSGLIPIDTIPYGIDKLSYLMPIFYGCMPLKMIMQNEAGFVDVFPYIVGLIAFTLLLWFVNNLVLKKYRTL